MIVRRSVPLLLALAVVLSGAPAHAKKFKYASGPKPPPDTVLSVAETDVEPVVRAKGPKVPATNLQLTSMVANTAFDRALAKAPLDSNSHISVAPISGHPLNFVVEHAILRHIAKRGVTATVRRSPVPEDSTLAQAVGETDPLLEYNVATARITYLRYVGWLPGRVKIERQALVEGQLTLRDPKTLRVLWVGDASSNLVDRFPRDQVELVEDARYTELKGVQPNRNVDKVAEPLIVVAIVTGLVILFFQNRP